MIRGLLDVEDKMKIVDAAFKVGILIGIIALAMAIRLLPTKWGIYLDEYDPYLHLKNAKFIVENGFAAWYNWHDKGQWYPWGIYMPRYDYPGIGFLEALTYMFLTWIGFHVSLLEVAVLLPVAMSAIAVIAVYLIGREAYNDVAGFLAATFFALSPTIIARTAAGFTDTESLGLPLFLLSLYFFIRSINKDSTTSAILSGIFLGLMCASWGAYVFPFNIYGAVILVAILTNKYDRSLAKNYVLTIGIALAIASQVPLLGAEIVTSSRIALALLAVLAIILYEIISFFVKEEKVRLYTSLALVVAVAIGIYVYWATGGMGGRLLAVVNPFAASRLPVFPTVGEHHPSSWGALYRETRYLLVFAIAGTLLLVRKLKPSDLVLLVLGIVGIYVGSVMIRLTVFADIAIVLLASITLAYLLSRASKQIKEGVVKVKRKAISTRWQGVALMLLIIAVATPITHYGVTVANKPAAIASSAGGYDKIVEDWMMTLAWMRDNLPEDAVVGAWWDYGYWINVMANKTTIADNGTINSTQIKLIAIALLSDEENAIKIFKQLGVTHFVVFEPWRTAVGVHIPTHMLGEVGKSTAMMYIAGFNVSDYLAMIHGIWWPIGPKASNTTLFRLLYYPFRQEYISNFGINIPPPEHFELIYASPQKWVLVYKILY